MKEREKKGPTLGIIQQCGRGSRWLNALSSEQPGSCADFSEANMEFARKKPSDLHNNICKPTGTCTQACLNFFRPPNRTTQEKVVASLSDCEHEDREFIVDSGTSLSMISKLELTCGGKDAIRRSKEPTVITTANGRAESTEEETVYVNDLDVFCHNDGVGRFTSSAISGEL